VTSTLETINRDDINAELLGRKSMANSSALVDDDDTSVLESLDMDTS
jgi:hypothetical protein